MKSTAPLASSHATSDLALVHIRRVTLRSVRSWVYRKSGYLRLTADLRPMYAKMRKNIVPDTYDLRLDAYRLTADIVTRHRTTPYDTVQFRLGASIVSAGSDVCRKSTNTAGNYRIYADIRTSMNRDIVRFDDRQVRHRNRHRNRHRTSIS